jgi:nitrate reductase gamma subunit
MNAHPGTFLFRSWPYLSVTLCVVGLIVRVLLTSDRQASVKRVVPVAKRVFLGSRLAIAAWTLLAGAHVAALLFPRAVLAWTRTPWHLLALETAGFVVGLAVAVACARSAWVHIRRPARDGWSLVADFVDSAFLSFLFISIASGLLAAIVLRWGSAWASVTVAPWAASLVHGRPEPAFVQHLPLLVRLHLFTAFAAVAVFPASRLAVFPLVWAHRALGAAQRSLTAGARPVAAWVRRGAVSRLWPDTEVRWLVKASVDGARKLPDKTLPWWQRLGRDGGGAAIKQPGGKAV